VLVGVLWVAGAIMFGDVQTAAQGNDAPRVLRTTVDDAITPVIADHLKEAVGRAEDEGYDAVVVELDTPGGLDTSMRKIVQRFLSAELPVVVYVSPRGARAASAGAIITFASHVAAMAPGTAIGAATPVGLEGGDAENKVINDAAALAESVARLRDRDVDFAVDTVREGRSASADEALDVGAIDLVAASLGDLLDEIDGRQVEVAPAGTTVTLRTAGAVLDEHDMGVLRRIQQKLADPNIAFLFLSIGTLALIYELASPGIGAGGAVGVVLILLALFSLSVLPVNTVGLLLLGLAAALFVAELLAPGVGVAAAGGTAALVLSGIFLFDDAPGLGVSMAVVAPVAAVVGGAVVFAGRLVLRTRATESTTTGPGLFIDRTVTIQDVVGGRAQALVEGAWWNVRPVNGELQPGRARIVDVEGLDLVVESVPDNSSDQQTEES
jgi:membrane-bound serine protease (ClpP class)